MLHVNNIQVISSFQCVVFKLKQKTQCIESVCITQILTHALNGSCVFRYFFILATCVIVIVIAIATAAAVAIVMLIVVVVIVCHKLLSILHDYQPPTMSSNIAIKTKCVRE